MAETNTETQEKQTPDLVSTTQETTTGTIVETQKPEVPMPDPTASEGTPQEEAEKPQDSAAEVEQEFANQKQTDTTIKKELTAKGLDFDALADEYDKTGSLSADSLTALEKAGYPKQMVDAYLAGLDAMADRFVGEVVKMAGGEDSYKALAQYLQTQPKNVIDGFNAALQSGSMAQIQLAIGGIDKTVWHSQPQRHGRAAGTRRIAGLSDHRRNDERHERPALSDRPCLHAGSLPQTSEQQHILTLLRPHRRAYFFCLFLERRR